jgi:hypothetical protein
MATEKCIDHLRVGTRSFQYNNNIGVVHPGRYAVGEFGIRFAKCFYTNHASDTLVRRDVIADDTSLVDGSFSLANLGLQVPS